VPHWVDSEDMDNRGDQTRTRRLTVHYPDSSSYVVLLPSTPPLSSIEERYVPTEIVDECFTFLGN
jgi:hypothetical protein